MVRVRVNGSIVYTVTQSVLITRVSLVYDINQKSPKQTPKKQEQQQQIL